MEERPPDPVFPAQPPLGPAPPPVPPGALRPPVGWGAPPPPTPPARSNAPWIVAAAVVGVVALLAGVLAVRGGEDRDPLAGDVFDDVRPTTTAAPAPTTTAPPAEDEPLEVLDVIADIQAFVEQERGLQFLRDPTVELVDDAAFEARLLEDFDEDAEDLATAGRVLEAVGLVEPGTDLVESMRSLLGLGVVGFYDPETEELVVRGGAMTPYVRTVVAHELVHALDDQHFDLDRQELEDTDDERPFGFTGLVEGNARFVEDAYRATFTPEEEQQAAAEELEGADDPRIFDIPLSLIESIQAPYLLGPVLVELLVEQGGMAAVDAAYGNPPTSSEHLVEPETFVEGDLPLTLPPPAADGEVIDQGVLGALGIAQLLGEGPLFSPGAPSAAVAGWGGDAYVAWIDAGGRACLRATIVGDTPEDTAEIADALRDWSVDPPFFASDVDATITGGEAGEPVTLTSCAAA